MKVFAHYSVASFLLVAVFFSLVIMNVISFLMMRKLNQKEEEVQTDSYYFAGYEIAKS